MHHRTADLKEPLSVNPTDPFGRNGSPVGGFDGDRAIYFNRRKNRTHPNPQKWLCRRRAIRGSIPASWAAVGSMSEGWERSGKFWLTDWAVPPGGGSQA
jgi:hypothetical protein